MAAHLPTPCTRTPASRALTSQGLQRTVFRRRGGRRRLRGRASSWRMAGAWAGGGGRLREVSSGKGDEGGWKRRAVGEGLEGRREKARKKGKRKNDF